jgi:hypothetical protein
LGEHDSFIISCEYPTCDIVCETPDSDEHSA